MQRHAGLGRRPIVEGRRPTTDLPNGAELGCSEENESCSGGYPEVIYSVWGMKIGSEAQIGARPPFGQGQQGLGFIGA